VKKAKRYIPVLITFALAGLITLQVIWLVSVYKFRNQELIENTREAITETGRRLQKAEDSRFIMNNIDSVLTEDINIDDELKEEVRVIVSNAKTPVGNSSAEARIEKRVEMINKNGHATTVISLENGGKHKTIIHTTHVDSVRVKRKAKDLQSIFLKMAINSEQAKKNISTIAEFKEVQKTLKEELFKRGIDLDPAFSVSYFPKDNRNKTMEHHIVCNTPGFAKKLPPLIVMPLLPDGIYGGDLVIKLVYGSTGNFVLKQMAGLLMLSLLITILIGWVMIFIFRKMLGQERLHQMKNDFINNLTHELKTPLATISLANANIDSAAQYSQQANIKQYTGIINDESKRLNDHIEKVFELSLFEKKTQIMDMQVADANKILEGQLFSLETRLKNENAELSFSMEAKNTLVMLDPFHFRNMIANIIDNAIKYRREKLILQISTCNNGNSLLIKINDNGIGISKEDQKYIFDKFFRVTERNLHSTKGFGIGLSYVKQVTELFGGNIEVKSEKGIGSEFIITLPNVKG
jgi:two-component system phosphate regulon sensor histidine kinase PhoR